MISAPFVYNLSMQFLSLSRRCIDAFPPEAFTPELTASDSLPIDQAGMLEILVVTPSRPIPASVPREENRGLLIPDPCPLFSISPPQVVH